MLLQYWGINISVDDLIAALPQEPLFQDASGLWHGPDPNHAFAGSPYTENSFGCYAPVIADTVRKFLPEAYVLFDASGTPLPFLSKKKDMSKTEFRCSSGQAPGCGSPIPVCPGT